MNEQNKSYHNIRVITFNLLSQAYTTPKYYPFVEKKYISFNSRKRRILKLIEGWTRANFIICFQEVSKEWKLYLEDIFKTLHYNFKSEVYAYENQGVGIAYPLKHFKLIDFSFDIVGKNIDNILNLSSEESNISEVDLYELKQSSENDNILCTILLQPIYKGQFIETLIMVSTYHMPCKYFRQLYMLMHIYSVKNILYKLQKKWSDNYCYKIESIILAGDFNTTPNSEFYKLLVDLSNTNKETNYDNINKLFKILSNLNIDSNETQVNLKSAFFCANNKEPAYTNVCLQEDKKFIDCIDYILITDCINVRSSLVGLVVDDPHNTPYPNWLCPSDHLSLSASLKIV